MSRLPRQTCFAAAVAIWLLGLLGPVIYCALWPVIPQPPFPMGQLALETNPVMRLPDFLIGMLVGRLFISGFRLRSSMVSISSLVAPATIGLLVSFSSAIPRLLLSNGVVTPSAVLLIFTLAHQKGSLAQVLSHPSLTALGEASYAIYILQFPLSYLLNLNERTFTAQRFSIYLITLMGVSLATFFSIEQPLRRRLRAVRSAENATPESRSGQRLIAHLPVGA